MLTTRHVLVVLTLAATLVSGAVLAGAAGDALGVTASHTCSDFANQAAAQAAHDTVDADHDGVYCESLPCPCSTTKPAGSGPTPTPSARATEPKQPATTTPLGPSVTLGRVHKAEACMVRGPLPDSGCTPGARFSRVTAKRVCMSGYSKRVRHVTQATKNAVYAAYGIIQHFNGQTGEVDHLVSLELGGSNSRANLFPEAAAPAPGSHEKDKLENALHADVCDGKLTLRKAQTLIAKDWVGAYRARYG